MPRVGDMRLASDISLYRDTKSLLGKQVAALADYFNHPFYSKFSNQSADKTCEKRTAHHHPSTQNPQGYTTQAR